VALASLALLHSHCGIGAAVDLAGALPATTLLFSGIASRIIVSFAQSSTEAIKEIASRRDCPFTILGETKDTRLRLI